MPAVQGISPDALICVAGFCFRASLTQGSGLRRICVYVALSQNDLPVLLSAEENPGIGGSEFAALRLGRLLSSTYPGRDVIMVTGHSTDPSPALPPNLLLRDWNDWSAGPGDAAIVSNGQFRDTEVVKSARDAGRIIALSHHPFDRSLRTHLLSREVDFDAVVSPGAFAIASNRLLGVRGVHIPYHIPASLSDPALAPAPDGPVNFVFMSSGLAIKGFWDVWAVWRHIRAALPQARLHVIGNLPDGALHQGNDASAGMQEDIGQGRVVLHGRMGAGKNELLRSMHIGIVNPRGLSECLPFTAFEMMAAGVPIVSSSRHGMYESMRFLPELQGATLRGIARRAITLAQNSDLWRESSVRSREAVDGVHGLGGEIAERWTRLADAPDIAAAKREMVPLWTLTEPRRRVGVAVGSLLHYRLRLRRRWRRAANPR